MATIISPTIGSSIHSCQLDDLGMIPSSPSLVQRIEAFLRIKGILFFHVNEGPAYVKENTHVYYYSSDDEKIAKIQNILQEDENLRGEFLRGEILRDIDNGASQREVVEHFSQTVTWIYSNSDREVSIDQELSNAIYSGGTVGSSKLVLSLLSLVTPGPGELLDLDVLFGITEPTTGWDKLGAVSSLILSGATVGTLPNYGILHNLHNTDISESTVQLIRDNNFNVAKYQGVDCSSGYSCYQVAGRTILDTKYANYPKAIFEVVDQNGMGHHAVMVYLNDDLIPIVVDNTRMLGSRFGSEIPVTDYLNNITQKTQYSTLEDLVNAVQSGHLTPKAFEEYITDFPQNIKIQVVTEPTLSQIFTK